MARGMASASGCLLMLVFMWRLLRRFRWRRVLVVWRTGCRSVGGRLRWWFWWLRLARGLFIGYCRLGVCLGGACRFFLLRMLLRRMRHFCGWLMRASCLMWGRRGLLRLWGLLVSGGLVMRGVGVGSLLLLMVM